MQKLEQAEPDTEATADNEELPSTLAMLPIVLEAFEPTAKLIADAVIQHGKSQEQLAITAAATRAKELDAKIAADEQATRRHAATVKWRTALTHWLGGGFVALLFTAVAATTFLLYSGKITLEQIASAAKLVGVAFLSGSTVAAFNALLGRADGKSEKSQ